MVDEGAAVERVRSRHAATTNWAESVGVRHHSRVHHDTSEPLATLRLAPNSRPKVKPFSSRFGPQGHTRRKCLAARESASRVDFFTHGLLPYAAGLAAFGLHRRAAAEDRRAVSWALAFGIAGAAPDFDALTSWPARLWDEAYFLQHRGVSHSAVGSVVFALLVLAAGSALASWKPRAFGLLRWRPSFILAAFLGAWTHLALDALTLSGIPLWWPFAFGRVSLQLFSWLVWWLFPIGGIVLLLHWRGRLDTRRVVQAGAIVVAFIIILAGVRVATRPNGEFVYPRNSEFEWIVLTRTGNDSWEASLSKFGSRSEPMRFQSVTPPAASEAITRAQAHPSYKGWLMQSYSPVVTIVNRTQDGWNVSFIDVAARYEALHDPRWTPARPIESWGQVSLVVTPASVTPTIRGW